MNCRDIGRAVAEIEAAKHDFERAHGMEDELYVRVLKAIAAGARNPDSLAQAALAAQIIKFPRHAA